jgi:hypothetical protein
MFTVFYKSFETSALSVQKRPPDRKYLKHWRSIAWRQNSDEISGCCEHWGFLTLYQAVSVPEIVTLNCRNKLLIIRVLASYLE